MVDGAHEWDLFFRVNEVSFSISHLFDTENRLEVTR